MLRGTLFSVADATPMGVRCRSSSAASKSFRKGLGNSIGPRPKIKPVSSGFIEAAEELVAASQQSSRRPPWGHDRRRNKLARPNDGSTQQTVGRIQFDSLEYPVFFNEEDLAGSDYGSYLRSSRKALTPGSYFESRRVGHIRNGIILAWDSVSAGIPVSIVGILTNGEIMAHSAADVMLYVPNFIDTYLTQRAGCDSVHGNEHELAARLKILKRACDFERQVEAKQFELARKVPDLYDRVRAENPNEWGTVNTLQAARLLEGTPNVPIITLFAVHKLLMERIEEYVCHPSHHHLLHLFSVRPYSHLTNYWRIKQWNRDRDGKVARFIKKANMLIEKRRELTNGSDNETPSRVWEGKDVSFTEDDKEIIQFLQLSIFPERKIQDDPYEGIASSLIKDCLKPEYHISKDTVYSLLQDIGVYTPWEDITSKSRELKLSPDPQSSGTESVTNIRDVEWQDILTESRKTVDSHESVRHDFGDLPVFVIDDVQAEELDDGVSIESISGEPRSVWIHVHVADPTSVLAPTKSLLKKLLERSESLYFIHRAWPMLPRPISETCQLGSLNEEGQNVLTFSAKIDDRGEILDHKVRAGFVRNVRKLKYDDVNDLLNIDLSPFVLHPFEPRSMLKEKRGVGRANLLPHAEPLKRLYAVTRQYKNRSLTENSFSFGFNTADVASLDKPFPVNESEPAHPIFYRGFPNLRYTVRNYRHFECGSRSLVAECMKIAGRIASRFCLENNIPVLRRSLPPPTFNSEADLEEARSLRDELGYVDVNFVAAGKFLVPPGEFTTEPAEHSALGVPSGEGYIRGTSPLRRLEDMISHWQIKHALLNGDSQACMPFSEDDLKRLCVDLTLNKIAISRAARQHSRNWTLMYIDRYIKSQEQMLQGGNSASSSSLLAQPEVDPLRDLEAIVVKTPTVDKLRLMKYIDVYIPHLGTKAWCLTDEELPRASIIKVNVKQVFVMELMSNLEVTMAERLS